MTCSAMGTDYFSGLTAYVACGSTCLGVLQRNTSSFGLCPTQSIYSSHTQANGNHKVGQKFDGKMLMFKRIFFVACICV